MCRKRAGGCGAEATGAAQDQCPVVLREKTSQLILPSDLLQRLASRPSILEDGDNERKRALCRTAQWQPDFLCYATRRAGIQPFQASRCMCFLAASKKVSARMMRRPSLATRP
jgi:hypothetical protein